MRHALPTSKDSHLKSKPEVLGKVVASCIPLRTDSACSGHPFPSVFVAKSLRNEISQNFRIFSLSGSSAKKSEPGQERALRPLYLDAACFFQYPGWFGSGWKLHSQLAPQDRDYLLPGPSPGLQSSPRWSCGYDMGFAIQGRLLAQISDATQHHLIPHPAVHFWTPHSSRTFMPSATSALGFPKSDRDCLRGWAARMVSREQRSLRQGLHD